MVKKVLLAAGGLALLLGLFFGRDAVTVVSTGLEKAQVDYPDISTEVFYLLGIP